MTGAVSFAEVMPYLAHPLALVGYCLFLFFGVHRALLKAKIIPPLESGAASGIVASLLRYGFWIALIVVILGFGLNFYQTHLKDQHELREQRAEATRLEALAAAANGAFCQHPSEGLGARELVLACAEAIHALAQASATNPDITSISQIELALQQLAGGHNDAAKEIFRRILVEKSSGGTISNHEAAEAARHLGSLAFETETQGALDAYQQAVKLDPNDAQSWNLLGALKVRTAEYSDAEIAFTNAQQAAKVTKNIEMLANSYLNLGIMRWMRHDYEGAKAMQQKGLTLMEALESEGGTASAYMNLGIIAEANDDLNSAESMYNKAISLFTESGEKEGLASAYLNLGNVQLMKASLAEHPSAEDASYTLAEATYRKALAIDEGLGRKEGIASEYASLGNVYMFRRDFPKAIRMFEQAAELDEILGRRENLAESYAGLGSTYHQSGDALKAREWLEKALVLFKEIGSPSKIAAVESMLSRLDAKTH